MSTMTVVGAANALARRWGRAVGEPDGGTVFAPVGLWPLLGALAAGADGLARRELEDAIGLRAEDAMAGARRLLQSVRRLPGVSAALGLWARDCIALDPEWVSALPEHTLGELAGEESVDRHRLDAWASKSTDGLIPAMPVQLDEDTRLVLASGMTIRTRWIRPFRDSVHTAASGSWAGRDLVALTRRTGLLNRAAVLRTGSTVVTELRVLGNQGIDVHLLLGDEHASPGAVLEAGVDALGGRGERVTADVLGSSESGPGMSIARVRSWDDQPQLVVTTVPFTVGGDHDLLEQSALFGLAAASDLDHGHFSGISRSEPLAVASARQTATATFGAEGFEAASVTAMGIAAAGGVWNPPPFRAKRVEVQFDRPFGFLAVHRSSRLVLAGGWVNEAEDFAYGDW